MELIVAQWLAQTSCLTVFTVKVFRNAVFRKF